MGAWGGSVPSPGMEFDPVLCQGAVLGSPAELTPTLNSVVPTQRKMGERRISPFPSLLWCPAHPDTCVSQVSEGEQ